MPGQLLEREDELAQISELIESARTGAGGLLLVEGVAGIGKTRLVEHACASASAAGLQVLRARGVALEEQFAFGVARRGGPERSHARPASFAGRARAGRACRLVA